MLQPKRSKHRKAQKGRIREVAKRGTTIAFGSYALKTLEAIWLTNRQLEAARQALTRGMKREGMYGSVFSLTSRSPRSRWKCVWVKVKVIRSIGRR